MSGPTNLLNGKGTKLDAKESVYIDVACMVSQP
jgi:hypothetical protein